MFLDCDEGKYGANCAMNCTCASTSTSCDEVSGTCTCQSGYTGSDCSVDINECTTATCTANSNCVNTAGSYMCRCEDGYASANSVCVGMLLIFTYDLFSIL